MPPVPDEPIVARYKDAVVEEIARALGLPLSGAAPRLLGPLFRRPVNRFARLLAAADGRAVAEGLPGASRRVLEDLGLEPVVRGSDRIPRDGPLIVASNHPGAYDSLAIMAAVPRTDLKVLISDAGLSRAFPVCSRFFIFTAFTAAGGSKALRESIRHLEAGGSLLIYPHVELEPDPEVRPGAREALAGWSPGLEIMLRRVPAARLEPTIVSGILLRRFARSPLARLRRREAQRLKLAEVMQLIWQMIFPKRVRPAIRVSFGSPLVLRDLPEGRIMPTIIEAEERLLDDHMASIRGAKNTPVP
jgi:hypothetical protein